MFYIDVPQEGREEAEMVIFVDKFGSKSYNYNKEQGPMIRYEC